MTNGRRGFATSIIDVRSRDPLVRRKNDLRRSAKRKRQGTHARLGLSAGALLSATFFTNASIDAGAVVAGYAPVRDEMDVLPLLSGLAERGHACALPVVTGQATPLIFRSWQPGAPLTDAAFGVSVPPDSAPVVVPDILLVPLLAFDAACRRIGYGAGYYDRTIAELKDGRGVRTIGIAYADQQVDEVPVDEYDQILDLIVTERSVFRPRS